MLRLHGFHDEDERMLHLTGFDNQPCKRTKVRPGRGVLLGKTRTTDVVDAAVVVLAVAGDCILTSDPDDMARLVAAAGIDADVVAA
jgi:hypothetical protein